jgi:hypothetical protein
MPELHEFWDPNEWELHAFGLLQDRHGALNVAKVPARHKGDNGLDYYCLVDQVAYQCYAVQEPCEVAVRAEKQQAKITTDLAKFCTKKVELQAMFGTTQIRRWILLVPLHDSSQVNAHAARKTAEVRALGLPYMAADFDVMIHDLDSFDAASRAARAMGRQIVMVPSQRVSVDDIEEWSTTSETLVTTLTTKLQKRVSSSQSGIRDSVVEAISWFLERENALDTLRHRAPEFYETLLGVISRHASRLTLYGPPPTGTPHEILRREVADLRANLQAAVPNMAAQSIEMIAMGTVADWLMRCPLDFPPYSYA